MWSGEDDPDSGSRNMSGGSAPGRAQQQSDSGDSSIGTRRRKPGNFKRKEEDIGKISFADFGNPWNFFHVFLSEERLAHSWCRSNGLLAKSLPCHICGAETELRYRANYVASESFRCTRNSSHERQTRTYSFFEGAKLPVNDIMLFLKSYIEGNSLKQCATFAGMSYGSTAVDWATYIRDMFKDYFKRNIEPQVLSGEIEIDESLFGRRVKYHRGNPNVGVKVWVFGLVERSSNTIILYPVNDRTEATLVPLIQRHVAEGSTIYSDGWSAYCDLNNLGYKHFTVLHKYAFKKIYVDVDTKEEVVVHTNRIEGAWKHAKDHFRRMSGTKSAQFEGHLAEVMWRSRAKGNIYESFFDMLKTIYALDGPPVFAYSRNQPLFDTWDSVAQSSPEKEMIMPAVTDAESESESSSASQSIPSILRSSSSASQQRQQETQQVIELSSDDSFIPPNRPVSQLLRPETHTTLAELFSATSISSGSDNEQEKTIVQEPSPVVRPKRSARLKERKARLEKDSDSSSAPSSPVAGPSRARPKRAATRVPTEKTTSEKEMASTSGSTKHAQSRALKKSSKKEHVCHPAGFEEKTVSLERRKRREKSKTTAGGGRYASKEDFEWNFPPSDDDFQ
ncbi:MAG: IS1595 family transposase [Candidatus Thiodiazotropha taylori]|nr:IS1595 family transposase [Candidatus Thiodiazotropha taylori]